MVYKIFLDTNIIIDFLDPLRPFHRDAIILLNHLDEGKIKAFYTESVVTTTAYIIRRNFQPNEVCEIIEGLNKMITLLPCAGNFIKNVTDKLPADFEDTLLYEMALHHQLDYFITSNAKDFKKIQNTGLPVVKAKDFNKLLIST